MSLFWQKHLHTFVLLAGTILIAVISARPYAGAWNDGSRLASVESLVDYHEWRIDESVFVRTPGIATKNWRAAYPPNNRALAEQGTLDKLLINDHFYSDKSPLPSVIMAGVYKMLQAATGVTAAGNPPLFCYLMALIFSGGSYIVSVFCMDATIGLLGFSWKPRLLLVWSFAFATAALPYTREVNNHIILLAVFSAIIFLATALAQPGGNKEWRIILIGSLMGIGYSIDLGTGPILVLCVTGLIAAQTRSLKDVTLALTMAFPWFLLHHLLNYKIGGVFKPANAVADYLLWPGSPFNAGNITGGWAHRNVWDFLGYAVCLLFRPKQGFITNNLPLYLCIPAIVLLFRNRNARQPLDWCALALIFGTWLIYAITSKNYSGECCTIRWFVPLLAPFYYLLAVFLKERPEYAADLLILTGWGVAMAAGMWFEGPWMQHVAPGFTILTAGALASWLGWRWYYTFRHRRSVA